MKYTRIKLRESHGAYRGQAVRILTPDWEVGRIFVTAEGADSPQLMADGPGLSSLAKLAMLAASVPTGVVHVPRSIPRPFWLHETSEPHDLVFWRHTLQIPASAWKRMRSHPKPIRPRTFSVAKPDLEKTFLWQSGAFTDVFDVTVHAQTVLLSGSRVGFEQLAQEFTWLRQATQTGAHQHLYHLIRGQDYSRNDLPISYATPHDLRSEAS